MMWTDLMAVVFRCDGLGIADYAHTLLPSFFFLVAILRKSRLSLEILVAIVSASIELAMKGISWLLILPLLVIAFFFFLVSSILLIGILMASILLVIVSSTSHILLFTLLN